MPVSGTSGNAAGPCLLFIPLVVLVVAAGIYKGSVSSTDVIAALVQPRNLAGLIAGNIVVVAWRTLCRWRCILAGIRRRSETGRSPWQGSVCWWSSSPFPISSPARTHFEPSTCSTASSSQTTQRCPQQRRWFSLSQTRRRLQTLLSPKSRTTTRRSSTDRQSNLVTIEYRSIGLIFKDGVGDPDAIAVQRELRAGTPAAPFVDFGDRVDEDRITILLAGGDRGPGRDGLRTDTMIVATVDVNTGHAALFGIPRNLKRVPLGEDFNHAFDELALKLWEWEPDEDEDGFPDDWEDLDGDEIPDMPELDCHCYPDLLNHLYGDTRDWTTSFPNSPDPGMDALAASLGTMIGLEIDYWMLVDMRGFVQLIDANGRGRCHGHQWTSRGRLALGRRVTQSHRECRTGSGTPHRK